MKKDPGFKVGASYSGEGGRADAEAFEKQLYENMYKCREHGDPTFLLMLEEEEHPFVILIARPDQLVSVAQKVIVAIKENQA